MKTKWMFITLLFNVDQSDLKFKRKKHNKMKKENPNHWCAYAKRVLEDTVNEITQLVFSQIQHLINFEIESKHPGMH